MLIRSRTFVEDYREEIAFARTIWSRAWWGVLIILLVLISVFGHRYSIYILNISGIHVIGAIGLNLLIGYTGQVSIGHAAFIAVGAYSTTILGQWAPIPSLLLILLSGVISGVVGMVVGIPCLRLRGLYLAMATMSFSIIIEYMLFHWIDLTNGPMGMAAPVLSILGYPINNHVRFFYCILIIIIVLAFAVKNLTRMKIGRAFVAIRDRDIAASIIGVNLTRYKVLAFGISSFYAGICGSLLAYYMTHINPESFDLFLSVQYIGMIIVGGLGSIAGSIFGAVFMTVVPELLKLLFEISESALGMKVPEFTDQLRVALYGFLIIVFLIFEPGGLFAIWQRVKIYFKTWPFSY